MKILYLHQYFNTPGMSGSTRSYEMAKRLVAWGHEVSIITSYREPTEKSSWFTTNESGIDVHWLSVPYNNKMKYSDRIKAFLYFSWKSSIKASSMSADVIFATSTPLTIAIPAIYACYKRKVPMVFEVRDLWPEVPISLGALTNPIVIYFARKLELLAYKKSRNIIALAPGMANSVAEKGYDNSKITVIPNGCDTDLFLAESITNNQIRKEHEWLDKRPMIIYAGTLGYVNGVHYLVDIAKALKIILPEARVVILGEGREYESIKNYANNLGVMNNNFYMLGTKSKRDTAKWLSAADITTSMIRNERVLWKNAVTNKFFDSLAAGKPIACNHPGWQTEIAVQEHVGFMLAPENPEQAAKQLCKYLDDHEWMKVASTRAKELAMHRFSREKLTKDLEVVLLDSVKPERIQ